MTRHKRHKRLLKHLQKLGYTVAFVSNGTSTCRGKIGGTPLNPHHLFGMTKKFAHDTPPLVQIKKGMPPYLTFEILGEKGDIHRFLGWKYVAEFVQITENQRQRENSRKAKEVSK